MPNRVASTLFGPELEIRCQDVHRSWQDSVGKARTIAAGCGERWGGKDDSRNGVHRAVCTEEDVRSSVSNRTTPRIMAPPVVSSMSVQLAATAMTAAPRHRPRRAAAEPCRVRFWSKWPGACTACRRRRVCPSNRWSSGIHFWRTRRFDLSKSLCLLLVLELTI